MSTPFDHAVEQLEREWVSQPRWQGIERPYSAADVVRLRGSVHVEYSLAREGAEQLWSLLHHDDYVNALGALTGGQAVEMVKAGLKAIYVSGWQVAADANLSEQVYPDQSLYAVNSVPTVVRRINNALRRADQIEWAEGGGRGENQRRWMAPIVADAEAGFGGALNAFELMKSMIEGGAAGVHWEDQLSSEKKCGHMGGKVLVPTAQHIRTLSSARLAADVCNVPTVVVARTDSLGATLITSDVDERDLEFCTGERSPEGFYYVRPGMDIAVASQLGLRTLRRPRVVRDLDSRPRRGPPVRRARQGGVPGPDAGVQLLAVFQLEEAPRRRDDRPLPGGARRHGVHLPVRHAGWLARPQRVRLHARPRLRGGGA